MATHWYWRDGKVEVGPVSFEVLISMVRNRSLNEDDLVRPENSQEWQTTDAIAGLFSMAQRVPVPRGVAREPGGSKQPAHVSTNDSLPDDGRTVAQRSAMASAISAAAREWDHRHVKPTHKSNPKILSQSAGALSGLLAIPGLVIKGCLSVVVAIVNAIFSAVFFVIGACFERIPQTHAVRIVAVLLLSAFVYSKVSFLWATQGTTYAFLDQTFTELKELRAEEVDEDDWADFQSKALRELEWRVPGLESSANIRDPASLSLLAICRDYLPSLLNAEDRKSEELEQKIESHLEKAKTTIYGKSSSASSFDYLVTVMTGLNVLLVLGTIWYSTRGYWSGNTATG